MSRIKIGLTSPALALAGLFSASVAANAQEVPRISETINGIRPPASINCNTGFQDGEPVDRLIAWVDTNYYHYGQTGPLQYALMSQQERQQYWKTDGVDSRNKPLYNYTAQQYDRALQDPNLDPVETLKTLLANSHRDFPISRWDDMAARCEGLR